MQHLSSVVPEALITCCRCRVAYHFFIIGQKTFMQCYTVALQKCLESAPVHAGNRHLRAIQCNYLIMG